MTQFRVWAPLAHSVELVREKSRLRMEPTGGGWYAVECDAQPGDTYMFSLDGGELTPDPRSPSQPTGVFGPSCVVDHRTFRWTDSAWQAPALSDAVMYEAHVGTFTSEGTFDAMQSRLDHLIELGVTHLELLPVHQFPGARGWGYDGVDLYAPQNTYGGPDGLKRLVDVCHARGLAVLLDVVYNHLGPSGNYLSRFGPYFTSRYHTPWGEAVNLDGPGSDEVRRFLCDNALMFLRDYHLDGLRLDAVHEMYDQSATHFLQQLATEVDALGAQTGRRYALIAESDLNNPRIVRSREVGGFGLAAQWSDDVHHALHAALTGERNGYYADFGSLADLAHALKRGYVYEGQYSAERGRRHGAPTTGLTGASFVAFAQNHDQIGNRAQGDRVAASHSDGVLRISAALICLGPFIPLLFQGEEWGATSPFQYFTDHEDPALAEAVREGRRNEFVTFGWNPEQVPDPQAPETLERSRLVWDERSREPHAGLLTWYRELLRLRRDEPTLRNGDLGAVRVTFDEAARWLVLARGRFLIACNLAEHAQNVPVGAYSDAAIVLASQPGSTLTAGVVVAPAESVVVVRHP